MANLPAVSKTYSSRANAPFQANTTALLLAQSQMFSLKQHLKGTLATGTLSGTRHANSTWTVKSSSNSSTMGSLNDGVDRWTTQTDLVWAANASPHSWIILENATLGYQVCIDCANASSAIVGIAFTEIAVPFTGGSVSTRPTSANEFCVGTTTTGATATFTHLTDVTTGNSNFTHYIAADDGCFFFVTSRTGLGLFPTFIALQKTINNRGGDTRNVFALGSSVLTARGVPTYATHVAVTAGCTGRSPNGAAYTTGGIMNAGTFGATNYPGVSGIDSVSSNYVAFPCPVMTLTTTPVYRGELPDLYQIGTAPVGGSIPSAAAQERVIVGDFVIPFPGTNPTI